MSFGLNKSLGRYIRENGLWRQIPEAIVVWDHENDYFNVIHQDGHQTDYYEDEELILWLDSDPMDPGFIMVNKAALDHLKINR